MRRAKLIVHGDVQGVFFRHHTKKEAESLDLKGWCRNEPDGSVYIIIEGEDKKVEKFIKWAKQGSPLAEVEDLQIFEEKYTGNELTFEIR
jgi:acylphosphatase